MCEDKVKVAKAHAGLDFAKESKAKSSVLQACKQKQGKGKQKCVYSEDGADIKCNFVYSKSRQTWQQKSQCAAGLGSED